MSDSVRLKYTCSPPPGSSGVDALPRSIFDSFGCGAAGALTLANTLFIQPQSIFGVQWSAYLIFMVLVGGLGTFEGPIIGAILFFVIQYEFADLGAWYLIGLGLIALAFALFLPRGLWSLINDRLHIRLLPVGYHLLRRATYATTGDGTKPNRTRPPGSKDPKL